MTDESEHSEDVKTPCVECGVNLKENDTVVVVEKGEDFNPVEQRIDSPWDTVFYHMRCWENLRQTMPLEKYPIIAGEFKIHLLNTTHFIELRGCWYKVEISSVDETGEFLEELLNGTIRKGG